MPCSKSCRITSKKVATIASKALRNSRTSSATKSVSASALSQRQKCKR